MRILVIPDTQVKPDVPIQHHTWIGRLAADKRPDVIVHLGDAYDFYSLNSYISKREIEGVRIIEDIEAGNKAFETLMAPIKKKRSYKPKLHYLLGNHENRLVRYVNDHPAVESLIGLHLLNPPDLGWKMHPFLKPLQIEQIYFAHYFTNPNSGRPWAGTCHTKLKNIGLSFVMGHQQGLDLAVRCLPNGQQQRGLVAGSCYLHQEDYRGFQGKESFQGVVMLNDVRGTSYDLMELSLRYLKKRYG